MNPQNEKQPLEPILAQEGTILPTFENPTPNEKENQETPLSTMIRVLARTQDKLDQVREENEKLTQVNAELRSELKDLVETVRELYGPKKPTKEDLRKVIDETRGSEGLIFAPEPFQTGFEKWNWKIFVLVLTFLVLVSILFLCWHTCG